MKIDSYDRLQIQQLMAHLSYDEITRFFKDLVHGLYSSVNGEEPNSRYIVVVIDKQFYSLLKKRADEEGVSISEYVIKKAIS